MCRLKKVKGFEGYNIRVRLDETLFENKRCIPYILIRMSENKSEMQQEKDT